MLKEGSLVSSYLKAHLAAERCLRLVLFKNVFRINDYELRDLKFSYWRTNSGIEVDLIASSGAGRTLAAIEIKSSTAPEE